MHGRQFLVIRSHMANRHLKHSVSLVSIISIQSIPQRDGQRIHDIGTFLFRLSVPPFSYHFGSLYFLFYNQYADAMLINTSTARHLDRQHNMGYISTRLQIASLDCIIPKRQKPWRGSSTKYLTSTTLHPRPCSTTKLQTQFFSYRKCPYP